MPREKRPLDTQEAHASAKPHGEVPVLVPLCSVRARAAVLLEVRGLRVRGPLPSGAPGVAPERVRARARPGKRPSSAAGSWSLEQRVAPLWQLAPKADAGR